mmetsp:Transcript_14793/g.22167  ORF Transcript_14793/g.22167 Transcript_14793/m.22167 type:complete len:274 (+) Transcript_14793:175-996(+)
MSSAVRPLDKVEKSPSSRATCRLCHEIIEKGSVRFGIHEFSKYGESDFWNVRYYHKTCMNGTSGEDILRNAHFEPTKKRKHVSYDSPIKTISEDFSTTQERCSSQLRLKESLRLMRLQIARRDDTPVYCIFQDTVLNSLVEFMPSNAKELLKIKGIGPQKAAAYGGQILSKIYEHKIVSSSNNGSEQNEMVRVANAARPRADAPASHREIIYLDDSDDEDADADAAPDIEGKCNNQNGDESDDEVILTKEFTVDEMVKKSIRDAEAKGNLIIL